MGFTAWVGRLIEATQVELHGLYSVERVQEFMDYSARTSILRSLFVLALMPWPCVVITLLVDLIPLRPPSEGLQANNLFIVRIFLSFLVASIVVNLQFRHSLPSAPLSNPRLIVTSIVIAAETTGVLYVFSLVIGFPVPFGIITVSPAWVAFLLIPLASFLRRARANPELWPQVINSLKVWVCQEALVVIYPAYFYIFTTLSTEAKRPFAFLLPIIKIFLCNVMSHTVVHLNDEIPEVVVMNVEVFNSLFMSYCMQNTPSLWTTLGLIAIDGAQMIASMRDVVKVIQRLEILKARLVEGGRQTLANPTVVQRKYLHRTMMLLYTHEILDRYNSSQTQVAVASSLACGPPSTAVIPLSDHATPKRFKAVPQQIGYPLRKLLRPKPAASKPPASNSLRKVLSARASDGLENQVDLNQLELAYAQQVRKVLYITEFMVLINYVEVIVPIIFSANLVVMYYLPNRVYYSQIVVMDDNQLRSTLGNVMLYCFLQLVSLVVLFLVLWHKFHISALRQLSFVLEKQGEQVQIKLIFWVFYNVQATLQHFASDYTFKFAWLHSPSNP